MIDSLLVQSQCQKYHSYKSQLSSYPPLCTINKLQSTAWSTNWNLFFLSWSRQWTRLCWYWNSCKYQQYNQCGQHCTFSRGGGRCSYAGNCQIPLLYLNSQVSLLARMMTARPSHKLTLASPHRIVGTVDQGSRAISVKQLQQLYMKISGLKKDAQSQSLFLV